MKQIPILSGKAMIVELKHKPIYMEIIHSGDLKYEYEESETGPQKYTYVNLPPGTWQIVGMLSEVTEEQAFNIVQSFKFKGGYLYNNYITGNRDTTDTAIKSLESAILAEGYTFTNPYGSTAPDAAIEGNGFDYLLWHESQSRVLCRDRCLILKKI